MYSGSRVKRSVKTKAIPITGAVPKKVVKYAPKATYKERRNVFWVYDAD